MKTKVLLIITFATVASVAAYVLKNCTAKVVERTSVLRDTITIYTDKNNITHASVILNPQAKAQMKDAISKEYYSYTTDTLVPALRIAREEIDRLTRVNARLKGEAKLVVDTIYNFGSVYSNKYMTIQVADSIAKYSYNATLDFVEYHKSNWLFGKDKHYLDISSPDSNFKIYGVQSYRKELGSKRDKLKVSILGGLQLGANSNINTGIRFRFNPDGIVSPYFGLGRDFYFNQKPQYYINGGAELNIYRK